MYMRALGWGYLLPEHNVQLRDLGWGYLLPGHNVHERFRVGLSVT